MYNFDVKKETDQCIEWIKDWFENHSGNAKCIILGISGGKDSTVAAKLCSEAIGKDKVLGVLMPNGEQSDFEDSLKVVDTIGINHMTFNIGDTYNAFKRTLSDDFNPTTEALINIPPRLRMTTLYAIGQSFGCRVCGTGNMSEGYVGYSTKWGDGACDFNPLANFTSNEVIAIGDELGLPYELVHKTPSDGLCGKSDEDNLGFSYAVLNKYIREGICEDGKVKDKINKLHEYNKHKTEPIMVYKR